MLRELDLGVPGGPGARAGYRREAAVGLSQSSRPTKPVAVAFGGVGGCLG